MLDRLLLVLCLGLRTHALRYSPEYAEYNLNQNASADDPLDYWGSWEGHNYTASPDNWRFPVYTLFLDKFVNGNPSNDNANGTVFEQDITSTQLRHGGDLQGLIDSLDYIAGMGIKGVYIAGSPFINLPWGADAYSPLDQTLLDAHFGDIAAWRDAIDAIHAHGMYVLMDNTVATMGDLLGFEGYLNASTPFDAKEYPVVWKSDRRYQDWNTGTSYNKTCEFPRFWNETGYPVDSYVNAQFKGCYDGDFDQFGDTEAFGVYPDYRRQITKFASVQDRLREWVPSVRKKLAHFSCMAIAMLDIDGYRFDKATQVTVDASGDFSAALRQCARDHGKLNFFLAGEITGGNNFGSVYLGRGRQPDHWLTELSDAVNMSIGSDSSHFLRDIGQNALDAAAFHYSIYRFMTRFLGMDGNLEAGFDLPPDWVNSWNEMLLTNDFVNPNTGAVDPRHMMGVTNQDVFRWPAIQQGIDRMLLGQFLTTILLPGIPLVLWGEEQGFYVLDNTADNYIYGRQAMSPSPAWWLHGCYTGDSSQYYNMPLEAARTGCTDVANSWDHRDPSAPIRNILRALFHLRTQFPVLTDGLFLQQLSNKTHLIELPGSNGTATELGIWSVMRSAFPGVQDLGNTSSVWLVYHNQNSTLNYTFDCTSKTKSFLAPFPAGTRVKNLIFPHDELDLRNSTTKLYLNGSQENNGCASSFELVPYEFRVYVPVEDFVPPPPMITKFTPGHDTPILSSGSVTSVNVSFHFSVAMSCHLVTSSIVINSSTEVGVKAAVDPSSVVCTNVTLAEGERPPYVGSVATAWTWTATLTNLADGIHQVTVVNATTADLGSNTNAIDHFLLRIGKANNPLVFPTQANYSATLLSPRASSEDMLMITQQAPGADMWRYSLNWGSTWSGWQNYTAGHVLLPSQPWSSTAAQAWQGEHVITQYWSRLLGSSSFVQHSDVGFSGVRRFPHLFANGPFNQYGFDGGIVNGMRHTSDGQWEWHYMDEWPGQVQLNVWGMNPDGEPDQTFIYGDVDNDLVLDRMPPSSLSPTVINITAGPRYPYMAYRLVVHDGTLSYKLVPQGDRRLQLAFFVLLWIVPLATGFLAVSVFIGSFYKVKMVEKGIKTSSKLSEMVRHPVALLRSKLAMASIGKRGSLSRSLLRRSDGTGNGMGLALGELPAKRRCVLIGTVEYNIDDWNIKVKIGGLGVMAQLMGKALGHVDVIWVVPCVGDIEYPYIPEEVADPMTITIFDMPYQVKVSYHQSENITYVLLDAPIFRQQTKAEPYPARMDNIDSAIYYSAWNQCIAEAMVRFPVDIYHINDYHGGIAPLYLLPERTVPCCLSLHNAEFQGLWPLRTPEERKEVSGVFNLSPDLVQQYVQFGSVFNLLHGAVSYLRIHQGGFGAVGVSKKYGDRSFARYPIFWGLSQIGQLPNPDPGDMEEWDPDAKQQKHIHVDNAYESSRGELRVQAQDWAGLTKDPNAELFVFVGRWSQQKGVDLIADLFPSILEEHPSVQLICIGPTIDLYGKFAAIKLAKLMEQFPGRVFSRPEFTALPPFIFSGAEFALIPSRDEPFGLVAVEFGRKGALGVGAKVGGLGQMPGWWYTIESNSTTHLLSQFRQAVVAALDSKKNVRAKMRAWSAKQRFPVAQWLEGLEKLQNRSIRVHGKLKHRVKPKLSVKTEESRERSVSPDPSPFDIVDMYFPARDLTPTTGYCVSTTATPASATSSLQLPFHSPPGSHGVRACDISRPITPSTPHYGVISPSSTLTVPQTPRHRVGSDAESVLSGSSNTLAPPSPRFMGDEDGPYGLRSAPVPRASKHSHNISTFSNASTLSVVSVNSIVGDRTDFHLQQVDPFFTDSDGKFLSAFEKKLDKLTFKNSISQLCIEEYLVKSEQKFFDGLRDAKLGVVGSPHRQPSFSTEKTAIAVNTYSCKLGAVAVSFSKSVHVDEDAARSMSPTALEKEMRVEYGLAADYVPPTGVKKLLQRRIGDWPIYAILLAFGQIIASNSYQITLLTGQVGETATKLYAIASIYLFTSLCWGLLSRTTKCIYTLSLPWFFYGAAFVLIGASPFEQNPEKRAWIQNVASGLYATGSSSGAIFFAFNFGDEGGSPVSTWILRACVIQGVQQAYTVMLWFWGNIVSSTTATSSSPNGIVSISSLTALFPAMVGVALLLWACGIVLFLGLPDFYRQAPDEVPSLYTSILRRKTTLWFFVAVVLQNYFLSSPYGRNWLYLFSSQHAPTWAILVLTAFFFIVVWALFLFFFAIVSKRHPWWLPLFALGLGAPRWAQMLWGTSAFGLYLPWAGSPLLSALLGRSLWLWLGLLDTIQNAGIGMILMLTLTRIHVCVAMIAAQVIGSVATIVARASAPNNIGPGDVFPDLSQGLGAALSKPWFWVALLAQLVISVGFFKFFRKEQISKP